MVLKVAPPLLANEQQIDYFVEAVRDVVEMMHTSMPSGPRRWGWRNE